MTVRSKDKYDRWRSVTVGFRVSPEESSQLNRLVKASGLPKQEYIMRRLECKEIVVMGSPKIYIGLKKVLTEICEELSLMRQRELKPTEDLLETIRIISKVIADLENGGSKA